MLITEFCLTVLAVVAPAIVYLLSCIYDILRKIHGDLYKVDLRDAEAGDASNGYAPATHPNTPRAVSSPGPA